MTVDEFDRGIDFLRGPERQNVLRLVREIRDVKGSKSTLYVGKRLNELNQILSPFGYWLQCVNVCDLVQRSAYGAMNAYREAKKEFSDGAILAMIDRALILNANRGRKYGEWTDILATLPPPASGSAAAYSRWVDELIANKPKRVTGVKARQIPKSAEEVLAECRRVITSAGQRLSGNSATRARVGRELRDLCVQVFEIGPKRVVA